MHLAIRIICLFQFSTLSLFAQNLGLFEKKIHVDNQDTLQYRIMYPQDFDEQKTYPLMLFLHGAGERGSDNEKQLIHGAKLFANTSNRTEYPALILFPQCPNDSYWAQVEVDRSVSPRAFAFDYSRGLKQPLQLTLDLVAQLSDQPYVDQERIYVMGLSMGGMGTFQAVHLRPDLFAAAVPICGAAQVDAYGKDHTQVPFWIFHGDADSVVAVQHSRDMWQRLLALDAYVSYTEYAGVGHGSWNNAFVEPNLLNWIFSQKKRVGVLAD
ncbi:MAG: prolyl oligopeptidase family serine peptidase [Saprospiraceae bacterium]|nr:prolyl oligopeptidase family serine peptidase [Saprospiraceae bacterium]